MKAKMNENESFINILRFENVCYPVRVVVMTRPLLESELEKAKVHCENGFFGHKIVNTEREMIVFFDKELSDKLKKWFDNGREFVEFEALTLFDTEIGCCGEIKTKS